MKKTAPLNVLLNINDSISYDILQQETLIKDGLLNLYSFTAIIEEGPESRERKYFIAVEDKVGRHCIGFTSTGEEIRELFKHFSRIFQLNPKLPIVEYSFPDIFPLKILILQPL